MANNQRHKDLIEEGIKEFRGAQTLFLFAKEQHDKFCKTSLIVKFGGIQTIKNTKKSKAELNFDTQIYYATAIANYSRSIDRMLKGLMKTYLLMEDDNTTGHRIQDFANTLLDEGTTKFIDLKELTDILTLLKSGKVAKAIRDAITIKEYIGYKNEELDSERLTMISTIAETLNDFGLKHHINYYDEFISYKQ